MDGGNAMRVLLATVLLLLTASSAAAHSARLGAGDRHALLAMLPATDADLARAEKRSDRSHVLDDLVDRIGIRDGSAELFEDGKSYSGSGAFSADIDGRGATLHLRW